MTAWAFSPEIQYPRGSRVRTFRESSCAMHLLKVSFDRSSVRLSLNAFWNCLASHNRRNVPSSDSRCYTNPSSSTEPCCPPTSRICIPQPCPCLSPTTSCCFPSLLHWFPLRPDITPPFSRSRQFDRRCAHPHVHQLLLTARTLAVSSRRGGVLHLSNVWSLQDD